MTKLLTLVPVAAALVLAACQETTSPAPSNSLAVRPAFAVGGGNSGLTLHPGGLGEQSFAKWVSHEGEPDSKGNADQALYFQKMVATPVVAAGFAVIEGLEGQLVSDLTKLSWDHRDGGWCGAGAPRWDVFVTGSSGTPYTLFLGCAAADHTPASEPGWITDSYAGAAIVTVGGGNAGLTAAQQADAAAGTITGLSIVFDEGTDVGPGFVFLDNITVNGMVWTKPADNSN
ncbi:MAG TPA: hypothetical protein VF864_07825 [Gemmatimonadales bacterium]